MRLFRLIIHVENKENLTYIASTKKIGIPAQPALLFHAATNTSHTHKKANEKLVLICPPSLYPQPLEVTKRKTKSCTRKEGEKIGTQESMGKRLCKSHLLFGFLISVILLE